MGNRIFLNRRSLFHAKKKPPIAVRVAIDATTQSRITKSSGGSVCISHFLAKDDLVKPYRGIAAAKAASFCDAYGWPKGHPFH